MKDDEIVGGDYDFGARIYDPRLGRWLAIDPLFRKYSGISPYVAFANDPIYFTDPDGSEIYDGEVRVLVTYDANNKLVLTKADGSQLSEEFNKNAAKVLNAMATTDIGKDGIAIWDKSPSKVRILISKDKPGGKYGLTTKRNANLPFHAVGQDVDVTIYQGSLDKDLEDFKSADPTIKAKAGRFGNVMNNNEALGEPNTEALGAVGTHEAFHLDEYQIQLDQDNPTEIYQFEDENLPINSEVTFREQYRKANNNTDKSWESSYNTLRLNKKGKQEGSHYKGLDKNANGKYINRNEHPIEKK